MKHAGATALCLSPRDVCLLCHRGEDASVPPAERPGPGRPVRSVADRSCLESTERVWPLLRGEGTWTWSRRPLKGGDTGPGIEEGARPPWGRGEDGTFCWKHGGRATREGTTRGHGQRGPRTGAPAPESQPGSLHPNVHSPRCRLPKPRDRPAVGFFVSTAAVTGEGRPSVFPGVDPSLALGRLSPHSQVPVLLSTAVS